MLFCPVHCTNYDSNLKHAEKTHAEVFLLCSSSQVCSEESREDHSHLSTFLATSQRAAVLQALQLLSASIGELSSWLSAIHRPLVTHKCCVPAAPCRDTPPSQYRTPWSLAHFPPPLQQLPCFCSGVTKGWNNTSDSACQEIRNHVSCFSGDNFTWRYIMKSWKGDTLLMRIVTMESSFGLYD